MSIQLKHVPCPAGNKCTAFQCIFGHANEQKQKIVPPREENEAPFRDEDPTTHDSPRKRLKVDQGMRAAGVRASSGQPTDEANTATGTAPIETKPVPHRSLSKPEPSIRKPAVTASPASQKTSCVTGDASQVAGKKTAVPPRKAESLNPRLLKSSPASHELRLKLVRMLHSEFSRLNLELKKDAMDDELKLVLSDQDLIIKALDEEQRVAQEKPAVYSNVMKNQVMQHKRMGVSQWKAQRAKELQAMRKVAGSKSSNLAPKTIHTGLPPSEEVKILRRLLTPIEGLSKHGYVAKVPTEESIQSTRNAVKAGKGWEVCDRCQQRFQVFPGRREEDGALATGGNCHFHWGKTYIPAKAPGDNSRVPKRFQCCSQEVGESAGCITHDNHVYKFTDANRLATVINFAATPENSIVPTGRAVCFDCEMAYTVHGLELIRLTATSWPTGEELLDVLVQPLGEILDLNSRYSGVWPDDLAYAVPWTDCADPAPSNKSSEGAGSEKGEVMPGRKKLKKVSSPVVARDLLFSLLSPSTPLIGHGLENDLNAVRIVHPTVVDTVLLYPHKGGLPFRTALKKLMYDHMNKKIQQETGPKMLGHDSAEDARAAGDLVRLKVMAHWQDMRRAGWRLVDGEVLAPIQNNAKEGSLTESFIES
ncbi:hypothetical protein DCS_01662 [Drechmeria coniospora]|uniref:Exonuclease domain-containing protein n=1 Tax=Drechmeria coniospora TaxID=98403 RepID=A0A151GTT9_DRECN|nr:hypothetical protein DCS_01662 [Drechmeria coniospora]KYK60525.1 hypothetical protein DCS_01662 [Drechmeria coniospora]